MSRMVRLATFQLSDILPYVGEGVLPWTYGGITFKMTSHRLRTFAENHKCVVCGRVGVILALEQDHATFLHLPHKAHLNLYAIDADGTWVLMTKDHIIPKAHGGQNVMTNYQTMCQCGMMMTSAVMAEQETARRHQWTREEAQEATARRTNTPAKPMWSESRKTEDGRYEYLVDGKWMSRQAVSHRRKKQQKG